MTRKTADLDDTKRQDLEVELMTTQIDKNRLDMRRVEQEMRWEPWKALAAFVVATAVFTTAVIGVSKWLGPSSPQDIIVHIDGKLR